MALDIKKLIEKTEGLVYDPLLEMAENGEVDIQEIKIFGKNYNLKVVIERIYEDNQDKLD